MDYMIQTSFFQKGKYLWNKNVVEGMIKELKIVYDQKESEERCFVEFFLEIEQAYRIFLRKIGYLPMIMNCRVKGNNTSNFGGLECAELMKAFNESAIKYLHRTAYLSTNPGSLFYVITQIRDKAKIDEEYARSIEEKAVSDYLSLGIDNTLKLLMSWGY